MNPLDANIAQNLLNPKESLGNRLNLIEALPVLSGKVDLAVFRIEGDPVENIRILIPQRSRQQAATVYSSLDFAVGRIDDQNQVGHVDICPDLPIYPFKFVEHIHRSSIDSDIQDFLLLEILVHEIKPGGAVTGDETSSVCRPSRG